MAIALVTNSVAGLGVNGGTSGAIDTTGVGLLVVAIVWSAAFGTTQPVLTDSKGNTWTALTKQTGSGSPATSDCYLVLNYTNNAIVGSGHTFTLTGTACYGAIATQGFSGVATSSPFDVQNGTSVYTPGPTFTSVQPGSITPSANNYLLITAMSNYVDTSNSSRSIDLSFNITNQIGFDGSTFLPIAMAYQIQTTATARNPTWSWSSAQIVASSVIASFKVAGGGSTPARRMTTLGVGALAGAELVRRNPWVSRRGLLVPRRWV